VPNAVQIHFTAGYGNDGKAAPASMRQAIRLLVADAYFNREPVVAGMFAETPALKRLLWRNKVPLRSGTRG
jgi:hypothetical protein